MLPSSNKSFQIHNYSFAAVSTFISEVKKHPKIYKNHTNNINSYWSKIVSSLLENETDSVLIPSQKLYWERIYRGLWMWMRHILTRDIVGKYLGQVGLSQSPKYAWLESLKFLEPFIQLNANSFNYDSDLDPFIYFKVLSSEETFHLPYSQYMVYWKQFEETLTTDTFYISICVQTMEYINSEHLKLEFELFLKKLNEIKDDVDLDINEDDIIEFSPDLSSTTPNDLISQEVADIIDDQLLCFENTEDYQEDMSYNFSFLREFDV